MLYNHEELHKYLKALGLNPTSAGNLIRALLRNYQDPSTPMYSKWYKIGVENPIYFPVSVECVISHIRDINDGNYRRYNLGQRGLKDIKQIQKDLNPYVKNKTMDIRIERLIELLNETKNSVNKVLEDLGKINEENTKLKKVIELLKEHVALTKDINVITSKLDIPVLYSLEVSKEITQQEYDLLEEVLLNEKES